MGSIRPARWIPVCLLLAGGGLVLASVGEKGEEAPWRAAATRFSAAHPGVGLMERGERITRVYGRAFSRGTTPQEAAERFLAEHAGLFSVHPADLEPGSILRDDLRTQPLVYRPEDASYRFTLVHYRQQRDGIPVYRADLRLLVRNESDHPLVWAGSALRELGSFEIGPDRLDELSRPELIPERFDNAKEEIRRKVPQVEHFGAPRLVIWAGVDDQSVEPRLALAFDADDFVPGRPASFKRRYLTDLDSGRILHQEERAVHDVSGTVSGMATSGEGADICEIEAPRAMPYVEVTDQVTTGQTDASGAFTLPGSSARVNATVAGQYFDVYDWVGDIDTASAGAPFDLLFNADNSDEFIRAQINGYVEANRVRDYVALFNPAYPTFDDTDIPIWVNRDDGFCPGNAWYDPGDAGSPTGYSINFCSSSSNRPNTAFSTVVHHEFGHHVVNAGGSGQGQYGEGMGDVLGVLLMDSPRVGVGFFNNCNGQLRNAANTLQYPCNGGIHFCGQMISGSVWSARNKLVVSEPDDYLDVLSNLAINAVLLHNGSLITPQITIDYLTLDDDDGDLSNGTPHHDEINAGFSAHNLSAPPIPTGLLVTPDASLVASGSAGGFAPPSLVYTVENRAAGPIDFSVAAVESWITIGGGSGTLSPGASAEVTVSLNSGADLLGSGFQRGNVFFVNETNGDGDMQRDVLLVVDGTPTGAGDVPQFISLFATASSQIGVAEDFCVGDVNAHVDITHGDVSELTVELASPAGTSIQLHNPGSGGGTELVRTFDDQAGMPAAGPGALADFVGESAAGNWTLTVSDNFLPNNGDLNDWSLELLPCTPTADPLEVTVLKTVTSPITLVGSSTTGAPLDYVIAELPAEGTLSDPNGGPILTAPYTLLSNGDTVLYDPVNVFTGRDGFSYKTNDGQDSNLAPVTVQVGDLQLIAAFDMDTDPGWTHTGQWAWGVPSGSGSQNRDPNAGFTGSNVLGYNLGGNYGHGIDERPVTSGAIDCSGFGSVQVSFRRWLGVEVAAYDHASFQASNDGTSWTTIWQHIGGEIRETAWSLQSYDLSTVADDQPTVYLRWVMGSTDGSEAYPGWNIDDVEVRGIVPVARVELVVGKTDLAWAALPDAIAYDVVRGDVAALRAGGGDFSLATGACLGDDIATTNLTGVEDPVAGQVLWYLVRGVAGPGAMSYDSFGAGQVGERDAEIEAALASCP